MRAALQQLLTWARQLAREERGQGLVEYSLVIALVALAAVVALSLMGSSVTDFLTTAANCVSDPYSCV
jgi:Flp pilus assembly pilin Flp